MAGAGLGNVIGSLFRTAVPILKPVLKNIGRDLLLKGAQKLSQPDSAYSDNPPSRSNRPVKRRRPSKQPSVGRKRRRRDVFG